MLKRLGIFLHYVGWFLFVITLGVDLAIIFAGNSIYAVIGDILISSVILCFTWAIRYILCDYKDIRCWKAK